MAEALLDAGANANTADEYGETPVTLAAANGDAALVQRLLAAGGNAARGAMERRDGRHDRGRAPEASRRCASWCATAPMSTPRSRAAVRRR